MARRNVQLVRELPWILAVFGAVSVTAMWLLREAPGTDIAPYDVTQPEGAAEALTAPSTPTGVDATSESRPLVVERRTITPFEPSVAIEGFEIDLLVIDGRGAPVADALVEVFAERVDADLARRRAEGLSLQAALVPTASARTDGEGRVAFEDVTANARVVARTDAGEISRAQRGIELGEGRGVLVVEAGRTLRVRVVDAGGAPSADAVVVVDIARFDFQGAEPWAHGERRTDENGVVTLSGQPGVLGVSAWFGTETTEIAWLDLSVAREITLHLPGAVAVVGSVSGRRSGGPVAPLADATVRILRSVDRSLPPGIVALDVSAAVVTDSTGRFELPLPLAGRYRLGVWAEGWGTSASRELLLQGTEGERDVVLMLDPLTTIEGVVVDQRGDNITLGSVVARWTSPDIAYFDVPAETPHASVGEDGSFVLEGIEPAGFYALAYAPPGSTVIATSARGGKLHGVRPGTKGHVLVVRGDAVAEPTGPFGRPVSGLPEEVESGAAGLRLEVVSVGGGRVERVLLARERRKGETWRVDGPRRLSRAGEDGLHAITGLVDGASYRFTLHAEGHSIVQTEVLVAARDAPFVTVDLPRAARLVVTVRRAGGLAPFAEVELATQDGRRSWRPRRADESGRVVFDDLLPGEYTLTGVQSTAVSEPHVVTLAAGEDADVELMLVEP